MTADSGSGGRAERLLFIGRIDGFRDKSLEEKVRELADREEIRELVAIYAHRMAHGPGAGDLFTDDGAYVNRGATGLPPREIRGRTALDQYYGDRSGWADRPLPMIHNQLICIAGDEATGLCSVEIRLVANGVAMVASGYYKDRYRREDGRWRFVERDCSMFHWVPLHQGSATSKKSE